MKKSLIALLLVVALVVTVSVFAASAETTNPFEGKTGEVSAACQAQCCSSNSDPCLALAACVSLTHN